MSNQTLPTYPAVPQDPNLSASTQQFLTWLQNAVLQLQGSNVPPPPTTVTLQSLTNGIRVVWNEVQGAASYQIWVGTTADKPSSPTATIPANTSGSGVNSYTISNLNDQNTRYVIVTPLNKQGYPGADSAQVSGAAGQANLGDFSGTLDNIANGTNYSKTLAEYVANGIPYNNRGIWSSISNYSKGDEVSHNGNYWLALADTSNSEPTTSNGNWQLLGPTSLDHVIDGSSRFAANEPNADNTALRLHLPTNTGFEAGSDHWDLAGQWVVDNSEALSGSQSAHTSFVGSTAIRYVSVGVPDGYPVTTGDRLLVGGWVKVSAGYSGTLGGWRISWRDASGNEISTDASAEISALSTSWQYKRAIVTAPSGAVFAVLEGASSNLTAGTLYIDEGFLAPMPNNLDDIPDSTVRFAAGEAGADVTAAHAHDINFLGTSAPPSPQQGFLWADTSTTPATVKRYNGTSWDIVGTLNLSADDVPESASRKWAAESGADVTYLHASDINFYGNVAPASPQSGWVWADTSTSPATLKQYNGSTWDTIGTVNLSADDVPESASRKWAAESGADVTSDHAVDITFFSSTAPSSPKTGFLWGDTATSPITVKRYNGTSWDIVGTLNLSLDDVPDSGTYGKQIRFLLPSPLGSTAWYKLGTWSAGFRSQANIQVVGGPGGSALDATSTSTAEIMLHMGEGNSPNVAGWFTYRGNGQNVQQVKAVCTDDPTNGTGYVWDLYIYGGLWNTLMVLINISPPGSFVKDGSISTDPGTGGNIVVLSSGTQRHDNAGQSPTGATQNNAINNNGEYSNDTTQSINATSETVIGSVTISTNGGNVEIYAKAFSDASVNCTFRLRKDSATGTQLDASTVIGTQGAVPLMGIDTSPASSQTYVLTAELTSGTSTAEAVRLIAANRKK